MFANKLPESVIKQLSIKVKAVGGINLGQGIPSFPTAPHIIAAAKASLDDRAIGVYPNFLGTLELRQAIVDRHNREHGLQLTAEANVLVTVGAMEAVSSSILSLLENGDKVGIITPDYCNHFPAVMLARGKACEIPMREDGRWILDLDLVETTAKQGMRLLIITNPNNPTGAVFEATQMVKLVELANKYGFWVLADETYTFLDFEHKFASLLNFWDLSERLLTIRSFSKEYAMTGWRVGYVLARPETIKLIAKTHDALVGCAPKISQRAALAALTGPQEVVAKYGQIFKNRRDLAVQLLSQLNDDFTFAVPEGAYYIFPKYKLNISSINLAEQILERVGLGVVPGSIFGKSGEGHLRLSFAVEDEILRQGIAKLAEFGKKYTLNIRLR
ncbi:MAG: Aspartate transaminase [Candidatus Gottesmanbacteria bacterium GW2011_GWB1_43_11]|uniref:Aminotransferase n=1 Tax=Candidatus Gottesmanbacteria bacterium GW2011_GWB1_43_11 TaxID=1618446 RepID=A0A0G1EU86_9BACT|nr:MAG: Aspartate transaminase [Candidatus Gottesmanbacteria bacterium GW2011_GWA2_42_16]KKS55357.1 MAG: Aspartate transaminase [Candidatus Gottesmanbacteria bacterium GW2011_GWA1_42_26]KKS82086.1 MAG: Aspartate transaminase [Candidatus Gottesmanbacteria bacterium GW2011_GWC1_43_10]KKS86601.1 MAG: Aspartate transaminase [Candidatus Gottesmanbacteria bacterium GW2011_GWB1_43_11]OGG09192.1 MAG: hypothetical protein A2699_02370 [Candidatus Gottesmanbacteria bacterium RIFCSPHIGHO2_01_FULL_43_15]OG